MSPSKNRKSKSLLRWFDIKVALRENAYFGKGIFVSGLKGLGFSLVLLALLILSDSLARWIAAYLDSLPNDSIGCKVPQFFVSMNGAIGIKNISFLTTAVSISVGVLGVLLGLTYTTFMTIVATKYSNVSSVISIRLLEQKSVNKYFSFLSTLTSLAFLFALTLSLGYPPTLVSCSIFSILIIAALATFAGYGKFSLIYFDMRYIVKDLISENKRILTKIWKNKKQIEALKIGRSFLQRIAHNIDESRIIISESTTGDIRNTSLDSISNYLLDFAIFYNSFKHIIPSNTSWHIQIHRNKSWENTEHWSLDNLIDIGVNTPPETIESFSYIENQIIDAQFELFKYFVTRKDNINVIVEQWKYLQIIAIQCDFEIGRYVRKPRCPIYMYVDHVFKIHLAA